MPTATTTRSSTVVDPQLDKLIVSWATAATTAEKNKEGRDNSWLSIAKYVVDNKVTKDQLKQSLIKKGGLNEKSVGVEVSRLYKFAKDATARKLLEKRLKGDKAITISQLRSVSGKKRGSDEIARTEEDKLTRKLMSAIKYAQKSFAGFETADEFIPYLEEALRKLAEAAIGGKPSDQEASTEEQLAPA